MHLGYYVDRSVGLIGFSLCFIIFALQIWAFYRSPMRYPKVKVRLQWSCLLSSIFLGVYDIDPQNTLHILPRLVWLLLRAYSLVCMAAAFSFVIYSHFEANYMILGSDVPLAVRLLLIFNVAFLFAVLTGGHLLKGITNTEIWELVSVCGELFWQASTSALDLYSWELIRRVIAPGMLSSTAAEFYRIRLFHIFINIIVAGFILVSSYRLYWIFQQDLEGPARYPSGDIYETDCGLYLLLMSLALFLWWAWIPIFPDEPAKCEGETEAMVTASGTRRTSLPSISEGSSLKSGPVGTDREKHLTRIGSQSIQRPSISFPSIVQDLPPV